MNTILAIGATSAIVFETLRSLAKENVTFVLAARDEEKVEILAADLRARGATVHMIINSLSLPDSAETLFEEIGSLSIKVDTILIGYGILPDQNRLLTDATLRVENYAVNFLSPLEHTLLWYKHFKNEGIKGLIAVISSVAGDRGRGSNFFYGSAKAGLDTALSGVRNTAFKDGIQILSIRPGFIDSPMTTAFKRGPLFTSSEKAGALIARAMNKRADIVYVPKFWWLIMAIIKAIPEAIFKRLSL